MPFFISWIKAIFIIVLAFPLFSDTSFRYIERRHSPNCTLYTDTALCSEIWDPICTTSSQTYINECTFCKDVILDKMPAFSSWINAIFIIVLVFPLYSEASFLSSRERIDPPNCYVYMDHLHDCKNIKDPICATNGQTYYNECMFCSKMMKSGGTLEFDYYGSCEP